MEQEKFLPILRKFHRKKTISYIAGLFTNPEFQPYTYRLEILARLVSCYCNGKKKPTLANISRWLNELLQNQAHYEDPPEDVFISNVTTIKGNFLIFEGIWEANDFYLQQILDLISSSNISQFEQLHNTIFSLLKLSDSVAKRAGLKRWDVGAKVGEKKIYVSPNKKIDERANYTIFSSKDLKVLEIDLSNLEPFILTEIEEARSQLSSFGNSSLEKQPVIKVGNDYILALPTAASPAIRFYVLDWMRARNLLETFEDNLHKQQIIQVNYGLNRLSVIPMEDNDEPLVENWELLNLASKVFQFDRDKYVHVVLLSDKVGEILKTGLLKSKSYSNAYLKALDDFLYEKSQIIFKKYNANSGITLLILGGLGRSRYVGRKQLKNSYLIGMSLADFMQLTWLEEISLLRLWKLHQQKEIIQEQGIEIEQGNELNLYAFWVQQGYCLIDKQTTYPKEFKIVLAPNFILTLRKNIRKSNDLHVIPFSSYEKQILVERFFKKSLYSSDLIPIYVPVSNFKILCGVIETVNCSWWLIYKHQEENGAGLDIAYRLWEALIQWLNKLLPIIESKFIINSIKFLEIYIIVKGLDKIHNYDDLVLSPNSEFIKYPSATINYQKNQIFLEINLSFLSLFYQPENKAEYILLEKIGAAIIKLLEEKLGDSSHIPNL